MRISKGDKIALYMPSRFADPVEGIVLAVTKEPGKTLAVVFDSPVSGGHTCDARGPEGRCLWVHPDHVIRKEQIAVIQDKLNKKRNRILAKMREREKEIHYVLTDSGVEDNS